MRTNDGTMNYVKLFIDTGEKILDLGVVGFDHGFLVEGEKVILEALNNGIVFDFVVRDPRNSTNGFVIMPQKARPASEPYEVKKWHPDRIVDEFRPRASMVWSWSDELGEIVSTEPAIFMKMVEEIKEDPDSFEPVVVGNTNWVWDGHMRILAAWMTGTPIPLEFINELRNRAASA